MRHALPCFSLALVSLFAVLTARCVAAQEEAEHTHSAQDTLAPSPAAASSPSRPRSAEKRDTGDSSPAKPSAQHEKGSGQRRHGVGSRQRRTARLVQTQTQTGQHGSKLSVVLRMPAPPLRVV
eukprot:2565971-Rhodomonas_salina.1